MAEYIIQDSTLREIADAIRVKTEKTDIINTSNFAEEILSISVGSIGAFLTVTAPANVTVTATKGDEIFTGVTDSNGVVTFEGLSSGTWTVTITNGSQTATKTVLIDTEYSTILTFFQATISVTYPEGSTCTCSDGTTILTASNTSGSYTFIVPNINTWIVTCTDGENTSTKEVSITTDGQSESIELFYRLYLYKAGDQCTNVTGGYTTTAKVHSSSVPTNTSNPTISNSSTYMQINQARNTSGICYISKKIDLREYDELVFDGVVYAPDNEKCWLCIWSSLGTYIMDNIVATIKSNGSSNEGVRTLNISSLNNSSGYYIGFYLFCPDYDNTSSYVKMNNLYLK